MTPSRRINRFLPAAARRPLVSAFLAACLGLFSPAAAHATAPSVTASTPSAAALTLGDSVSDSATVTGDPLDGIPTGSVAFSVCGPLPSAAGCAGGGVAVGSPVPLSAGTLDTATAISASFTPTASGTWCFDAEYSGDAAYSPSGDASATECFTVGQAASSTSSAPATASIALGATDGDTATVSGNTAGGSPTGTVSFFVCGPLGSSAGCAAGGTAVGGPVTLAGAGGNTATASSPSLTPSAPGTWCFRAEYSGDGNYTASSDGSAAECFTVGQASATTSSTPASASIALGGSDSDSATVSGNPVGGSPTGTISFYVCGPLRSAGGCTSGGTEIAAAAPLTSGTGDTATATSPAYTPMAVGTWCFRAVYSGDGNYTASSDGSSGECFTVGPASSTTSSTPAHPTIVLGSGNTDSATVTGNSTGGSPTGTVTFVVCGPLGSASGCASGGQQVGGPVSLSAGSADTAHASSASFTPTAAGTWCFAALYSGDSNYGPSSDTSSDECFSVSSASSTTASTPMSAAITLGAGDSDSATVTGNPTGGSPTGTVSFFVCGPLSGPTGCPTGGGAVGGPVTLTAAGADTATASSPSFTPSASGTWCFRAEYSGDPNYGASSDGSATECYTVGKATPSITSSPSTSDTTLAGSATDDALVNGNAAGGSPTGTVTFSVCGPLTSASTCPAGGQQVGGPVSLTPGSPGTGDATSAAFTPTAPGIWCFRADYAGDGNYNPATQASASCFTASQAGAPTASIGSPASGSIFAIGQHVAAAYRCAEAPGGPGIASCSGTVANGALLDTSARGPHVFTVTAVSRDGLSSTVATGYLVAGAPTVTISSPADGATYTRGQDVPVVFNCWEDAYGPGVSSCSGPSSISTAQPGTFALTATAVSADGLRGSTTVNYSVVEPSNNFTLSAVHSGRGRRVALTLSVPDQGTLVWRESALRRALVRAGSGRMVLSEESLFVTQGGVVRLVVVPRGRAKRVLAAHRGPVWAQLTLTFTPTGGSPRERILRVKLLPARTG